MARSLVEDVARKGKLFLKIKNKIDKIIVPKLKIQVDPEVDVQVALGNIISDVPSIIRKIYKF